MAGTNVVDLCIQKLNSWDPKNNNGFLRRVAYVVSEFGKNANTTESDGIWQVSQTAFQDTLDTSSLLTVAYPTSMNKIDMEAI